MMFAGPFGAQFGQVAPVGPSASWYANTLVAQVGQVLLGGRVSLGTMGACAALGPGASGTFDFIGAFATLPP